MKILKSLALASALVATSALGAYAAHSTSGASSPANAAMNDDSSSGGMGNMNVDPGSTSSINSQDSGMGVSSDQVCPEGTHLRGAVNLGNSSTDC